MVFTFSNDLVFKADIRDAVEHEMQGLGYRMEAQSPDLIVNFRVFDQQARIKGYEGYGQGILGDVKNIVRLLTPPLMRSRCREH